MRSILALLFLPALVSFLPLLATGQTLTITNGIQTYSTLTNTTVTMSNRCELRVTGTNNPIAGSIINLNSPDAWVLLPNIRPSVVQASYLGQFFVNGVVAALNTNIRLSEYAMGTMVIPHSSNIRPLQAFNGPNFLGASTNLALYTYYTNTMLGTFNRNISSFRLKRGYMATFAQNVDGTGACKVFVAQDGDLDVGALPSNLDDKCTMVRVFPWRWTAKKGFGGGSLITNTLPPWWYDWGNSSQSTVDREFVPLKDGSGGAGNIDNKQNVTHVLGYNEPDSATQANTMTTAAAIADWPTMMKWGLRVGAPAVSDSGVTGEGKDWLYDFMNQATNLGYRVDYIPIHWYKCGQSASSFSNYLADVYNRYKLPIWVTEWNNGASWCQGDISYDQNTTTVSNFMNMLEASPFVERYAIYPWWTDTSGLCLVTNNVLTPLGVMYLNYQSKLAHTQVLPPGGSRGIAQFHFDTNTLDSSGYANNGFALGNPNYVNGPVGQAVALDGTNSYIQLPPNVAQSNAFTFAAWVNWNGSANLQRIFDFGNDATHYFYMTPSSGSGTLRFAIRNGGSEQIVETAGLPAGQWRHIAFTLSGSNAKIFTNGVLGASSSAISINPSNIKPAQNYLGKSQSAANPLFGGQLDEVQIADYALSDSQIAALVTNTPPQFSTNLIVSISSTQSVAYSSSIAGSATDADPGDVLTYSKITGPAWLNVAADGTLTGTPTPSDGGTNIFTVRVTDSAGASAFAGVVINTVALNANGAWNADANGLWNDTNNWNGGLVANGPGFTADFSAINITADRTVTLDISRSIGTLRFGDTSGTQLWTLAPSGGSALTLDTGTGGSPSIVVSQNTATISAPLAGLNGFTKTGAGTLTLAGVNAYSGMTVISAGSLNYSSAVQTNSGIISGSGALSLTSGTLTLSANNTYTGGTTVNGGTLNLGIGGQTGTIRSNLTINVGARVNLTAADALGYPPGAIVTSINVVGGTLTNGSGGNEAFNTIFNLTGGTISSGGGYYNLNGANAAINSLATNVVSTISAPLGLRASGLVISTAAGTVPSGIDLNISGVMGDLQGSGFFWAKSGAGTLQLSGVNTNTGGITINAGTLVIGGAGRLGNGAYAASITNNGTFKYNSSQAQTLSGGMTGTGALMQNGAGALTLSGANNYSGITTINGGRLALGSGVTLPNTPLITVAAGGTLDVSASGLAIAAAQTLTGVGAVLGNVTNNGTLTPGGTGTGVLTCSNNVALNPGGTTSLKLNKSSLTNDVLRVLGTLNYSGTLVVTNLSGSLAGGDAFKLFSMASYAGNFSSIVGSPGAGLEWKFNPTNGTLTIFSTVAPNLSVGISNGSLEISWPADHLGWTLQVQTNDLSIGLGTSWISISNSAASTQFTLPMDSASPSVFYRLVYP